MTVFEIVADVVDRFDSLNILYAVGGSLASSTWGQMRQTNDADIVVQISEKDVPGLVSAFGEPYYLDIEELHGALTSNDEFRSVQILHLDEAFKIDLFILSQGEYEATLLARALSIEVFRGTSIRFYSPENIIIAKLRWFELGHRVSDRQWNDIVQVLEVQRGKLDDSYLDRWAQHFRLEALLGEARIQASH